MGPQDVTTPTATGEISRAIWQLTEDILELLRARARNAVHKHKRPELLWLDDLTETQGNTVIAVRQLCEVSPEGVTLKKLAETMKVTPAAASVMVDLLVKKKMLRRTRSKSDRRAVVIRLTADTAALFDISEASLRQSVAILEQSLGPETLRDWQRILVTATAVLGPVVNGEAREAAASSDDEEPSNDEAT